MSSGTREKKDVRITTREANWIITHVCDFFHVDPGKLTLNKVVETKPDAKDFGNRLA